MSDAAIRSQASIATDLIDGGQRDGRLVLMWTPRIALRRAEFDALGTRFKTEVGHHQVVRPRRAAEDGASVIVDPFWQERPLGSGQAQLASEERDALATYDRHEEGLLR